MAAVLPSQHETDGFIFAIAAAPEIPLPERWMPWLVRASEGRLRSDDVDTIADHLMACLRMHLDVMRHEGIALPAGCRWDEQQAVTVTEATFPDDVSVWLKGLLTAHHHVEGDWQHAWQTSNSSASDNETRAVRLKRALRLFSTLADIDLALEARTAEQAQALKNNLTLLWRQLPQQLADYVALSGELEGLLPNQFETFQQANPNAANDAD